MNGAMMLMDAAAGGGVSPEVVGAIVAAVVVGLLGGGAGGIAMGRRARVDAKIEDQFLSRREFDKWQVEVGRSLAKLELRVEASLQRVFDKIDERDRVYAVRMAEMQDKLADSIKETAANAYTGRGKLWDAVQAHGERLATMESTCLERHHACTPGAKQTGQ
jgi:hypothetical protein